MKPVLSEEFVHSLTADVKQQLDKGEKLIGTGIQVTVLIKINEDGLEIIGQDIASGTFTDEESEQEEEVVKAEGTE